MSFGTPLVCILKQLSRMSEKSPSIESGNIRSGLRDQVVVQLVVGDPIERVEEEDLASLEGTTGLVDELVVPVAPGRSLALVLVDNVGRTSAVPVNGAGELGKVERPATLGGDAEDADGVGHNGTLGRASGISALAQGEDDWADWTMGGQLRVQRRSRGETHEGT